jgi:hypothetical protein
MLLNLKRRVDRLVRVHDDQLLDLAPPDHRLAGAGAEEVAFVVEL